MDKEYVEYGRTEISNLYSRDRERYMDKKTNLTEHFHTGSCIGTIEHCSDLVKQPTILTHI